MSYDKLVPVFRGDVLRTAEDISALTKTLQDWVLRLQKQQAPQELQVFLLEAMEHLDEAHYQLVENSQYFPEVGEGE